MGAAPGKTHENWIVRRAREVRRVPFGAVAWTTAIRVKLEQAHLICAHNLRLK